ncbi:MAG: asparagine synthase (glutamine-hydrolyzing) [Acidobacteria bacterium]|nr:asparagine synthase (glutamine-hydrolyzing) [Acidobacteriota bacterium]
MCGITGFTHRSTPPDPSLIRRSTASITHRGPDQQGVWESPLVSLGATRLKILDLAGGDQPIASPDGGAVIVYNGEVYNHGELRTELESLGHRFQSRCDTETILAAFLQWDTACFRRLRGMFAIAIWDARSRRLMLARDRLGIKPLYYAHLHGEIYFGSELKTILEHPEVPRTLDPDGLAYFLSLNYIPTPYTLVQSVSKLRPGHFLEWRDGNIRTECFWNHALWPRPTRLEDATAELDTLLRRSVREHLLSDVPLGVWASGGLDSSTILHYAAQEVPRLKTFSVSFRGHSFDESRYFREVARHYGTDHHEFDLNPDQDLAGAIESMSWHSDEPSADAGALPVWFLSKMCRRHVTVALSGEGADELFAGYTTYLADRYARLARRVPATLRRGLLAALRVWPASNEKIGLDYKLRRFLEGSLLPEPESHLHWGGSFSHAEQQRLLAAPSRATPGDLYRWLPAESGQVGLLNRHLWADQRYYLTDDILYKCDRMSMAHSLEVRPPFLDHRIVEFAAALPEDLKIRGGQLKFVVRELMKNKLPACVLNRPKEGFDIPTHLWFRTVLKPLLLDTLNERSVSSTGVFQWPAVQAAIGDHLARRRNLGYPLWGLVTLFLWMKRWKIQANAERNIPLPCASN